MRKRATQAQKQDRISFVMDALVREYSDDLIIQALIQKGLSAKQAGRYLKKGYEQLGLLALEQDPVRLGKAVHRANKLAKEAYQAAMQDEDPSGKKTRASIAANKSAVDIMKTVQSMGNRVSGNECKQVSEPTEINELAELLQLFGKEQEAG